MEVTQLGFVFFCLFVSCVVQITLYLMYFIRTWFSLLRIFNSVLVQKIECIRQTAAFLSDVRVLCFWMSKTPGGESKDY